MGEKMESQMITIKKNEEVEIVEKKSRFIANVFYIQTVEEAQQKLAQIKRKYYDAKHHCYAYRVLELGSLLEKSSDDGEPSGTAGAPILSILKKQNLQNVLLVVTRYFGGILLGTGGLVRAYSEASLNVLESAGQTCLIEAEEAEVTISYSNLEQFQYFCKTHHIPIFKMEYLENIKIFLAVTESQKRELKEKMSNHILPILTIKILQKKFIDKKADI